LLGDISLPSVGMLQSGWGGPPFFLCGRHQPQQVLLALLAVRHELAASSSLCLMLSSRPSQCPGAVLLLLLLHCPSIYKQQA